MFVPARQTTRARGEPTGRAGLLSGEAVVGASTFMSRLKAAWSVLLVVAIALSSAICLVGCSSASGDAREANNVIVMISDGCGYNHVDATSFYQYGRAGEQVCERFRTKLAVSTYMAGQTYEPDEAWSYFNYVADTMGEKYTRYTDSAAAATAMSTGVKTYKGAIGVDLDGYRLANAVDVAEEKGKVTGVVTSVQLSHATPAGFVAHSMTRSNYEGIASQMFYDSALEVIMGCGHPLYTADNEPGYTKDSDENDIPDTYEYKYVGGEATWVDLSDGFLTGADGVWTVIEDRTDFQDMMTGATPDRVIGVARAVSTLQYDRAGAEDQIMPYEVSLNAGVPTLEEMTGAALNVLDDDPDGFFLMVEGGAIDWAASDNSLARLIEEQIDFNRAVEAVVDWVEQNSGWRETLVIVTSDHECGYLTGPDSGLSEDGPVWKELVNYGAGSVPGAEFHSKNHTNSLVPLYAQGAGSSLFEARAFSYDPVRGRYIHNADVGGVIVDILK